METKAQELHIIFFPLMAQGHMIPVLDMAKIFASHGVKCTIITTPLNSSIFTNRITQNPHKINLEIFEFPSAEVGLSEGVENMDQLNSPETQKKFFKALKFLKDPLEEFLKESHAHCLVADVFFHWANDVATKFGIPTIVFHGTSFFAMCCFADLGIHEPHKLVSSDLDEFELPGLPHKIRFTRSQLPDHIRYGFEDDFSRVIDDALESGKRSYGMIVNSFYELEPDYADYYRNVMGRRAWHIGPFSLCNRFFEEKLVDEHECLKWLDSKKPNSVIYVCFGTTTQFQDSQLLEIAMGLEASEQHFIWVVRKNQNFYGNEKFLPEGFEDRTQGKGLIVWGWAPQVLILEHKAVGGFVTHCGWNSTLEGISAGLPMVTWPVFAEQFFNEKLVTDVLRNGVGVGAKQWVRLEGDSVKREAITKAVRAVMVGEESEEMRMRARELGEKARRAVEEGGSSYNEIKSLIEELKSCGS
ncbi:UDP-glucuronosyl/UDP-glucosyltransferase [Dillenia turbinata]|uniref:Glycosyltransferase n=1 Tax=Dillenia turbinata TaxID=194707 RepID=A0AAN8UGK5_9MAGN